MKRQHNDGLKKRCGCGRRQWAKCSHPWHFGFQHDGREYRFSLHKVAKRLPTYVMSKGEAEALRDTLRGQIRDGKLGDLETENGSSPDGRLTFGDVVDRYLERHVRVPTRRSDAQQDMEWHLATLRRTAVPVAGGATMPLEAKPIDAITKADVEAVRQARRAIYREAAALLYEAQAAEDAGDRARAQKLRASVRVRGGVKGGEVGINRLLRRLSHVFSWAIAEGFVTDTPFKRNGVTVVKLETRIESPRQRRLEPGEDGLLLKHASVHLRALVVAALHTGCRLGELLSLQWHQIRRDEQGRMRWIVLLADRTKTSTARVIPIGPRLRAELEMRRTGPDGREHSAAAYVFGNEAGERIGSIKTGWRAACRRAGIRELHFHDLRREFASRLLESGASEHDVRDFLGHANITTTSRYLATTPLRLEKALSRLEEHIGAPAQAEAPGDGSVPSAAAPGDAVAH